jgi:hypothetical protein
MTLNAAQDERQPAVAPLEEAINHVRGSRAGRLIIEYGDYECPGRGGRGSATPPSGGGR